MLLIPGFPTLFPPNRTVTLPVGSKAAAGPSSAPGPVPGFSFLQSMTSFRRSTLAAAPVPISSVPMKMASGPLKSASVVHITDAAEANGLERRITDSDNRKNTLATPATRNFARDSPPRNPGPRSGCLMSLMRRTRLIVSGAILEGLPATPTLESSGPRLGSLPSIRGSLSQFPIHVESPHVPHTIGKFRTILGASRTPRLPRRIFIQRTANEALV